MYESVRVDNKVTLDEVFEILKSHLANRKATVTITTEPPAGYVPPRPLAWVDANALEEGETLFNTSRRYVTDSDGNVFFLAVTASVDALGKPYSIVTAKSVAPYTTEEYDIFNTTTRAYDLPDNLRFSDHGYSGARSGGRNLSRTAVGRALVETVHDVLVFAKDKEVDSGGVYFISPNYADPSDSDNFNEVPTRRAGIAHDLVNQYNATIGHKVTIGHDVCRFTILNFIVALAGLNPLEDMGAPAGYAKLDKEELANVFEKLELDFIYAVYEYVTTPNNEVYLLIAGEDYKPFNAGVPTFAVCAIRIAPPVYWGEKIEPTVAHGDVPISEDMRHSYYGRNIARAVDALLTPIS